MSTSATYAVNLPLTNYIVGWYGTPLHDPARFLAPGVQAPGLLTSYKRYLRQDAFAVSDTRRGMYAVSYTHLDVYKRQAQQDIRGGGGRGHHAGHPLLRPGPGRLPVLRP